MGVLGYLFILAGFVCQIIILIDAFKNEVWKGIVGFICGFYLLYYAIVEYKAPNKALIVGIWIVCSLIGGGLVGFSMMSTLSHLPAAGGSIGR